MGWSIPTYAGLRAIGPTSNYRVAMFELCRAINERETACGIAVGGALIEPTQFWKADGTLGSNITMSDLLGMRCVGAGNLAQANLVKIRGAILRLSSLMTETAGESPVWTTSTLSTAVGYDMNVAATRLNQAEFWQAMQDALDLLLYPWYGISVNASPTSTGGESDGNYGTVFTAWAARDYISGGVPGSANMRVIHDGVYWDSSTNPSATYSIGALPGGASVFRLNEDWQVNDIDGTIVEAIIDYQFAGAELSTSVNGTVNGENVTFSNGSFTGSVDLTPWTLASGTSYNATIEVPSICPFNEASGPEDVANRFAGVGTDGGSLGEVRIYVDISAALTDQA